jgi:hypothetical protein
VLGESLIAPGPVDYFARVHTGTIDERENIFKRGLTAGGRVSIVYSTSS